MDAVVYKRLYRRSDHHTLDLPEMAKAAYTDRASHDNQIKVYVTANLTAQTFNSLPDSQHSCFCAGLPFYDELDRALQTLTQNGRLLMRVATSL